MTGEDDKLKFMAEIRRLKPDTVVAVGGDGTVNFVASNIAKSGISMGIIPMGTANGLAYNLNIPEGTEEPFSIITKNIPRPVDLLQINNKYCIHLGDAGINARIVKRFEEAGKRGPLGYTRHFLTEFFSKKVSFSFFVSTPERKFSSRAEMIVVANAKSFGNGIVINPLGDMNDGLFEIIIVRPYPWWMFFYFLKILFTNKIDHRKYIRIISTGSAVIRFKKPHDFQIDGEIVKNMSELKITCIKKALQVHYEKIR